MPEREIYLLSPRALSPETIAVAFAKTSRSPQSFRDIAAELSDEKSAQFHEKWVVGYGHASVAEHAVLHIAFENVSRLAIESLGGLRSNRSTKPQEGGSCLLLCHRRAPVRARVRIARADDGSGPCRVPGARALAGAVHDGSCRARARRNRAPSTIGRCAAAALRGSCRRGR